MFAHPEQKQPSHDLSGQSQLNGEEGGAGGGGGGGVTGTAKVGFCCAHIQ